MPITFSSCERGGLLQKRLLVKCMNISEFLRYLQIERLQISRSVVSDSLRPHELQHAKPPLSIPNFQILFSNKTVNTICELMVPKYVSTSQTFC